MIFFLTFFPILVFFLIVYLLKQSVNLDIVLLFVMLVFMSSITTAPDIENYKISYAYNDFIDSFNWGFKLVINFFSQLGLSFYQFYLVYHTICLVLVLISIRLIFNDSFKCLLLYMVSPFVFNVIQIKNFGMMALLLLAFAISYRSRKLKMKIFIWVVLIFIASSQHVAGLAYLPFIFLLNKTHFLEKCPIFMFLITSLLIIFGGNALNTVLQPLLALTVENAYRASYYAEKLTSFGGFYFMAQAMLMIFIAKNVREMYSYYKIVCEDNVFYGRGENNFTEYVYNLTLYSSFFWPLFVASAHYTRLIENQLILIYILVLSSLSMYQSLKCKIDKVVLNDLCVKIVISFILLLFAYVHVQWFSHREDVVVEIFGNLKLFYAFL